MVKIKYATLEPDLYTKPLKMNTEAQDIETHQNFVVPLDNIKSTEKPELPVRNDSVIPNNKKNKQGMICIMKRQKLIHNHQVII